MDFPPSTAESTFTVMNTGPFTLNPTSGTNFGLFLDMRKYQGFYMDVTATVQGNPSEHAPILVVPRWYYDTTLSLVSYQDTFEFWADNPNSTQYFFAGGVMSLQDIVHGPYLQLTVSNGALTTFCTVSVTIAGTSRLIPNQFVRQQAGSDGIIGNSSATISGAQAFIPCCVGYGNTQFIWQTGPTNPGTNVFIRFGSKQNIVVQSSLPINSQIFQNIIVPKRAPLITFTGTNGTSVAAFAINQYVSN